MMYRIFNPDHEIAMAANVKSITPSRNVRQMCADLGFMPALWSEDGDVVIVEDVEKAWRSFEGLDLAKRSKVTFLTMDDAAQEINAMDMISPWGWNKALREKFIQAGTPAGLLPDDTRLENIRLLSHRSFAVEILRDVIAEDDRYVGVSHVCYTEKEVQDYLDKYGGIVLKAPWSCSGRGVRFVHEMTESDRRWMQNVISLQGSIIVEEEYDKVLDFAVEFEACKDGRVLEKGLSLFSTNGSAYTGNMLMSESAKMNVIQEHISDTDLFLAVLILQSLLSHRVTGEYSGPLGVDMMIVRTKDGKVKLHPCVEINLRMTMGYAAWELANRGQRGVMRTVYNDGNFKLILENTIKQLFK